MCEHAEQVELYYDGELPATLRAAFDAHLPSCAGCQTALAQLQQISGALRAAPLPDAPTAFTDRSFNAWVAARAADDAGLRRLAGWMTAAAAVVLIAAMLRVATVAPMRIERPIAEASAGAIHDWELAAVMPPDRQTEDAGSGSANLVQLAQWMARDLSLDDRR